MKKSIEIMKKYVPKVIIGTVIGISVMAGLESAGASGTIDDYGGYSGNSTHPPIDMVMCDTLSSEYGMPICISDTGEVHYYHVGMWYNLDEMLAMPVECHMYGLSPYALTNGDGE